MRAFIFRKSSFLPVFVMVMLIVVGAGTSQLQAQGTGGGQQLERVEVEPPERRTGPGLGSSGQGFGYDQSIPSGQPISDFPLTPSEVVSPTRSTANIATVPSAIDVIETKGVTALGNKGVGDMVQGQPGTWASGYSGNTFNSQISIRGFSATPAVANRVAMLLNGRNMEIPISEQNSGMLFPEIIERIELMRGDGTVQFGNKAIGGSYNILLKKPRTNPGTYFGVEGGSWRTQREWAAVNVVKGPLAAGIFLGNYNSEGWRLFYGNGQNQEFASRPGPWELMNVTANVNWKITPRLSFDLTYMYTKQRMANPNYITMDMWDRRDVRSVDESRVSGGPEERWDTITIGTLFYDGGTLGTLELIGSYRPYYRQNPSYLFNNWDYFGTNATYVKWLDSGLSLKYSRKDTYDYIRNDLTVGADLWDGFYGAEKKAVSTGNPNIPNGTKWTDYYLAHRDETHAYRESVGYYLINQTRFWDRLVITLGYRTENYSFPNLYYRGTTYNRTITTYPNFPKSASLYGVNLVYDKKLGSNMYYKHARTYRFPTLTDMINTSAGSSTAHPLPIYPLVPEDGTLQEWAIRHWFSPNIYLAATYYQLDMDNEIMGAWDTSLSVPRRWNTNVPQVYHEGLELEGTIKLTPKWTLNGNLTKQAVKYGVDQYRSAFISGTARYPPTGSITDKWVPVNPNYMYNCSLVYDNTEWGFSASIAYRYAGKRYFQGDDLNQGKDNPEAKIGDLVISQKLFDGSTTIYFGIKNFNDCMYLWNSYWDYSYWNRPQEYEIWPDAGRTYYMGVKGNMDFDRMKLPSWADLQRMRTRLYGSMESGVSTVAQAPGFVRSMLPF